MPSEPPDGNTALSAAVMDDSPVVATVNETPITERMLTVYQQQRQSRRPNDRTSSDREAVLQELINLELARQAGVKQGLDQQPEVELQLEQQRRAVIAAAAIQRQLQENPVSDDELEKLYEANVGGGKEYRARHILVEDEQKARDLIKKLDQGADFSELAREHSTGPSGKAGGELGWFSAGQMVEPFSAALAAIEKGTYTEEPVKTQFGWHIIMLDDAREASVPSFEQVKSQLRMMAQNQRVQSYVAELRRDADIEINLPADEAAGRGESSGDATESAGKGGRTESASAPGGEQAEDAAETGGAAEATQGAEPEGSTTEPAQDTSGGN
jgi:peptidyl-prolyl cis-trans isomerase C